MDRISEFIDYLQVRNEFGQTIYGHLAQIIAKLLDDHPEDAAAAIASISREIKASVGCYDDETAGKTYEPVLSDDDFARLEEILKSSLSADHTTSVLKPCKTIVPNILRLNEQLKLVGQGFDDVTASILQKRISQFEIERRGYFSVISFFGRFTTTTGHYYVLECLPFKPRKKMFRFQGPGPASVNSDILNLNREPNITGTEATEDMKPPPSALAKNGKSANYTYLTDRKLKKLTDEEKLYLDPDDLEFDLRTIAPGPRRLYPHVEPAGDGVHPEGINRFVYFATADLLVSDVNQVVKWIRLPDLEARQLKLSRFINVRLSGNLSRRIYDRLPPFPGCEAHYLRCIITRIKHGAELAPAACLVPGPEPEEADEDLTEEEQAKQKALSFADPAVVADFSKDSCEPDEPVDPKIMGKSVLPWPERNKEIASVEFVELLELANWVHACPVLSHRGKVLPWTYPEDEEEPEEEAEEEEPEEEEKEEPEEELPVEEKAEDEEDVNEEEKGEDGEEKGEGEEEPEEEEPEEPLPPPKKPVQERLDAAYAESDQLRILTEATDTYKQIARQKCCFTVPRAFWEAARDPWDPVIKENRSVYQTSRYFGLEIAPVDINCKEQELDDKEREYWDKEQEIEDTLKEQDEQLLEGDNYDEEKEVLQKDRPEMLSTADTDAPLVLYAGPVGSVDVNAEEVDGQKVVPAYTVVFNKTLNRHSPVVIRSNRWPGMLNVCFNHSNGDPLVYTSIYIGDGRQTESINALDKYRAVLPAPMQLPPADILEEDDPVLEIETECRERVEDIERRDKDELDRLIRERLERKEARLAEKRAREEERARELAAQEEQEEAEEEDDS